MELPETLTIGHAVWNVETLGDVEGLCVGENTILVRVDRRSDAEIIDTLLHEAFHAAFPADIVDDATEERIVAELAKKLTPTVLALKEVKP